MFDFYKSLIYIIKSIWALCVFLQPTLFFHINAWRDEINTQFFKMLYKKESNTVLDEIF